MAIEKKLIHFNEDAEFKKRLNNNEILNTSIVFIKDTNKIYTHGTEYQFVEWSYIDAPEGYTSYLLSDRSVWRDNNNEIIFVKDVV